MGWLESLVLGVVQGITEFLPISSDGHLLLVQNLFARLSGTSRSGRQNLFFDVMLHLGTTIAILIYNRSVVAKGCRALVSNGAGEMAAEANGAEDGDIEGPGAPAGALARRDVVRAGALAAVATLPLVPLALGLKDQIESTFEGTAMAGLGFLATAAILLVTAWAGRREGRKGLAETTWLDALLIGLAQTLAPLPGVSRSGTTIAAALALGLRRSWAVGFSLLIAVPAILGAVVFELRHVDRALLGLDRVAQTLAATALAGVVGYFAIHWLFRVVRAGRIWYFSVYLIAIGTAVLVFL